MFKRAMLLLLTLMMVPAFASAAVYWQIATSTSPASYNTNLTAAPSADYTTTLSLTKVTNSATTSVDFNVAAVAGTSVVVRVDGVQVGTAPGTYAVAKGTKVSHNIVAYYTPASNNVLTTKAVAGGSISPSKSYATDGVVTVTPYAGYTLAGVIIDGTTYAVPTVPAGVTTGAPTVDSKGNSVYPYTFASGPHTVQGVFAVAASAKAVIGNGNISVAAGASVVLDGSTSSSNVPGTTYAWSTTDGTLTATADPKKVTFTAPASYTTATVTLTLNNTGVTPTPATTIVITKTAAAANVCLDCHNGTDGPNPFGTGATTTAAVTAAFDAGTHGSAGKTCSNCHNPNNDLSHAYAPVASISSAACVNCHTNAEGWEKSSHKTSTHYPGGVLCSSCHNPHSDAVAVYGAGTATGCQSCHAVGSPYGIYNADFTAKAPHGGGKFTVNGAIALDQNKTQYLTQGAICSDCHGHNNTINAGFAEGGHGKVSDEPYNAWNHYDWQGRLNNGTRQNGNCDRCHTAGGFAKLLGATDVATRLAPVANTPQAVLNCLGCHKTAEGELRIDATPAGNPTALSGGYFALYSSTAAALGAGNTKIEVQFPGFKNSSICIPCHSGRTTDKYVRDNIATLGTTGTGHPTIKNYSTLQGANYQHAANMGQTFIGKGAWEFTPGKYASFAANQTAHTTIGMAAGNNQGPCVGCHYSEEGKTHSLEINYTSTTCTPCHNGNQNLAKANNPKFGEFSSARFVLDQTIRSKFAPLLASGDADLNTERAGYWRFGRFGKAVDAQADYATAQNAYGAWYNWQLVKTWDAAAWAHNPAYARQIIFDTLAYLQSNGADLTGTQANSEANVTAAIIASPLNAAGKSQASDFVAGRPSVPTVTGQSLCIGCHAVARNAGSGYVQDNNGVRAITGAGGEFQQWSHHIINDVNNKIDPTDAQCAVCHMEGKSTGVGAVAVDAQYHMAGNTIFLRNGNTGIQSSAAYYEWNPANPDHTTMDKFCMSCHNADGAPSAVAAIPLGTLNGRVQTALNPFADLIQNNYDGLFRNAVVPAYDQFDPTNTSHHAVRAARYTANTANTTSANAMSKFPAGATKVVPTSAVQTVFDNISANNAGKGFMNLRYADGTSYVGTMADTGKFITTYKPLADNNGTFKPLTDNSQLHCGDCHTVGQWAARGTAAFQAYSAAYGPGVSTFYKASIGAHGSKNEYMLRNALGDNSLQAQKIVCSMCHSEALYSAGAAAPGFVTVGSGAGSPNFTQAQNFAMYNFTGARKTAGYLNNVNYYQKGAAATTLAPHGGVSASLTNHCTAMDSNTAGLTGLARLNSASGGSTQANGTGSYATNTGFLQYTSTGIKRQSTGAAATPGGGNALGIMCLNCHNSGDGTYPGYGGIHGNAFRTSDGPTGDTTVVRNAAYSAYSSQGGTPTSYKTATPHKPYRFLPGLGNFRYNGAAGSYDETNYQVKANGVTQSCYTLGQGATTATYPKNKPLSKDPLNNKAARFPNGKDDDNGLLGTWGSCTDHTGVANTYVPKRNVLRPTTY